MKQTNLFKMFILLICNLALTTSLYAKSAISGDTTKIVGCMDPKALNYNPNATTPGNCDYPIDTTKIVGCMDPKALNYNPKATVAGNCDYPIDTTKIVGCMDPKALNYNPKATVAGNCDYPIDTTKIVGCMDPKALNYNPKATVAGNCDYPIDTTKIVGCMDPKALNYNPKATIAGNCDYPIDTTKIVGCMDPKALNYNPKATVVGKCDYPIDTTKIKGCTNVNAFNYNPYAVIDDSSCSFKQDTTIVFGCTDPKSLNFKANATKNDGSCKYSADSLKTLTIKGCMDPLAYNFNQYANFKDNSCLYKQIQINNLTIVLKSEIKDTIGSVVFNNCIINYSLPILNATIENASYKGLDSVTVLWSIYQSDGKKSIPVTYFVDKTILGKRLFILTLSCANFSNGRINGTPAPMVNTFGDVVAPEQVTGLESNTVSAFNLFPIPTSSSINFTTDEEGTLTITNLLGEVVFTTTIESLSGEINISNLNAGAYIYKFTGRNSSKIGKIIKQ